MSYLKAIGQVNPRKLSARWIELKRHRELIDAELKAISEAVINNPEQHDEFKVIQGKRSYVPIDLIKAHVGQEWYDANTITKATAPYIKIRG